MGNFLKINCIHNSRYRLYKMAPCRNNFFLGYPVFEHWKAQYED